MLEVCKAVIEKDGKYLLLKRASHSKSYPDLWDFAGGKLETGETPAQGVVREVKEETGFIIEPGSEVKREKYRDEKHDILFHYFIPKIIAGEFQISSDHSDFMWAAREDMNRLELQPAVKLFFG